MACPVRDAKRALRADLRQRRHVLSAQARERAGVGIAEQLDALVARLQARTVSCYLATSIEPATQTFVDGAVARGLRVLLPITRVDGLLDWVAADPEAAVSIGALGVPEPAGELLGPIAVGDVDVMIVPATAVDRRGTRLGAGRGYFDKTLGSMRHRPPVYAVVYDTEVVDDVPKDVHDQPVDGIVTPTTTLTVASRRR